MSDFRRSFFLVGAILCSLPLLFLEIFNSPNPTFTIIIYLVGLGLMGLSYFQFTLSNQFNYTKNPLAHPWSWLLIILFTFMPPLLSNDVFIYIFHGKLGADLGITSYTNGLINYQHEWIKYVDDIWKSAPNNYGPAGLLLFISIAFIAGNSLILNLIGMKIISIIAVLLSVFLMYNLSKKTEWLSPFSAYAILMSPVVLIQGIGQMHIDHLTMLSSTFFIYGLALKREWISGIAIGFLGAIKLPFYPIFIGFLIIYLLWCWLHNQNRIKPAIYSILISVLILIISYMFVWEGAETITIPLSFHSEKPPVKSHLEILYYLKSFIFGSTTISNELNQVETNPLQGQIDFGQQYGIIFQLLAVTVCLFIFLNALTQENIKGLFLQFGKILLIVFILFSPNMKPWYFLMLLPFFVLAHDQKTILKYISITFTLGCAYEIAFLLPIQSPLRNTIMAVFSLIFVLSYYIYFHKIFLKSSPKQNFETFKSLFNKRLLAKS